MSDYVLLTVKNLYLLRSSYFFDLKGLQESIVYYSLLKEERKEITLVIVNISVFIDLIKVMRKMIEYRNKYVFLKKKKNEMFTRERFFTLAFFLTFTRINIRFNKY